VKEFVGMNANRRFDVLDDGAINAQAEVILLVSEHVYYMGDVMFHRERPSQVEALRFHTDASGIEAMIAGLQKLHAELRDLEERVTVEPKLTMDDEEAIGC